MHDFPCTVYVLFKLWWLRDIFQIPVGVSWYLDLNKKRGKNRIAFFPKYFAGYCNFSAASEFFRRNIKPPLFLTRSSAQVQKCKSPEIIKDFVCLFSSLWHRQGIEFPHW